MTVKERFIEAGYEDVLIFSVYSYDSAFIGVSEDNRAIYDYGLMVDWLCREEGLTETEAIEWIDYNTIRALPYGGPKAPIILYRIPE
jgi:hypothetical protein